MTTEAKGLPGEEAALHERTACGAHKDGSFYLRACDEEDAGHIEAAGKKHGISMEKRSAEAEHHGRKGVYPHFHSKDAAGLKKVLESLKPEGEAQEEGTDTPTDTHDGGKHIHLHLHEGEGREVKKSHIADYAQTRGGKLVQVRSHERHPIDHQLRHIFESIRKGHRARAEGRILTHEEVKKHLSRFDESPRQTTVDEAIHDAEKKDGLSHEETGARYSEAANRAEGLSQANYEGVPKAEDEYAAHEAHTEAAKRAREHAEALGDGKEQHGGTASDYHKAAADHDKAAAWHKYLGDAKMKGRPVKKSLDPAQADALAEVLGAAQRWNAESSNPRSITKALGEMDEAQKALDAIFQAAQTGLDHGTVLDAINLATGGAAKFHSAVDELLKQKPSAMP